MKTVYDVEHICCGCGEMKKTFKHTGLDPRRKDLENFLCKRCDTRVETWDIIFKKNRRLKETHSIFGFRLEDKDRIQSVHIKII